MSKSGFCIAAVVAALMTAPAAAHHSYVEFNQQSTVEIEGTLVAAAWQNPHSRLTVALADGTRWDIESSAVNGLRRAGAPLELFEVGTQGQSGRLAVDEGREPPVRDEHPLRGRPGAHLVSRAAAVGLGRHRLWSGRRWLPSAPAASARTIFRTWGSAYARPGVPDDPDASPSSLWRVPLPLTEAARQAEAGFDAVKYNMSLGCAPKNMPFVMVVPGPTDFVDRGETILLRIEEFDVVRTIHMNSREIPPRSPKHRSATRSAVGRARRSSWRPAAWVRSISGRACRLGLSASFLERFTPSADGQRLHYTVVMTDPYSLTQPVEQKRSWVAIDEQVLPYNCTWPN